jgi:segregation and condensation protein A
MIDAPFGRASILNVSAPSAELEVDLPLYSGPFRLLANLILDQKMDVCDVPVARITDDFVSRGLARVDGWTLEEATWFLATCAALLELKVGRLLPRPVVPDEEDLLGGASPDLLYARTIELAAFRRVAERMAESMASASLMVPRNLAPPSEFSHLYPDLMDKVSAEDLAREAARLLAPARDLDLSHVTPIRASLAEALAAVQSRLAIRPESLFRDLLDDSPQRIEVVVRFLALLELYREGKVELRQAGVFGDIEVRWQGPAERAGSDEGGRE